jgi:hypothetical protein
MKGAWETGRPSLFSAVQRGGAERAEENQSIFGKLDAAGAEAVLNQKNVLLRELRVSALKIFKTPA